MNLKKKLVLSFLMVAMIFVVSSSIVVAVQTDIRNRQNETLEKNEEALEQMEGIISHELSFIEVVRSVQGDITEEYILASQAMFSDSFEDVIAYEYEIFITIENIRSSIRVLENFSSQQSEHDVNMESLIANLDHDHEVFVDHLTDDPDVDRIGEAHGIIDMKFESLVLNNELSLLINERDGLILQDDSIHMELHHDYYENELYEKLFKQRREFVFESGVMNLSLEELHYRFMESAGLIMHKNHNGEEIQNLARIIRQIRVALQKIDDPVLTTEDKEKMLQYMHDRESAIKAIRSYNLLIEELQKEIEHKEALSIDSLEVQIQRIIVAEGPEDKAGLDYFETVQQLLIDDHLRESSDIQKDVSTSNDEIEATTNSLLIYTVILGMIALAISILVGYLIAKRISTPVVRLTEIAKEVVIEGKMDTQVDVESDDEIGDLAEMYRRLINMSKNALDVLQAMEMEENNSGEKD